jgi:hypothetical protein
VPIKTKLFNRRYPLAWTIRNHKPGLEMPGSCPRAKSSVVVEVGRGMGPAVLGWLEDCSTPCPAMRDARPRC